MPNTQIPIGPTARIRAALEALPGVHRVFVDEPAREICLVCERGGSPVPVEAAAYAALAREGVEAGSFALFVTQPGSAATERRVRFEGVQLERPHVGIAVARVALEWEGKSYAGAAEGEGGAPCELRVCAQATMRALEEVLAGALHFDLVGIKAIRIFDHDLIAVVLRCREAPDRRMIGASLVLTDLYRSAALAVLNATNRLLGNYLVVTAE